MGKSDKIHERVTTPVANLLDPTNSFAWVDTWMAVFQERTRQQKEEGLSLINFHKARLGRQDTCFTGFRRFWVWDRPLWRIYVNTEAGVGFEVPPSFTPEQCWDAFQNYQRALLGKVVEAPVRDPS